MARFRLSAEDTSQNADISGYMLLIDAYRGFLKWGYPTSWMVYNGESHLEIDENSGYPYFRKPPSIDTYHTTYLGRISSMNMVTHSIPNYTILLTIIYSIEIPGS